MQMTWDWEIGEKELTDITKWTFDYKWIGESQFSQDGEKVANVACLDEGEFSIGINGNLWSNIFDNIWNPRFSPDGRFTCLVSSMGMWTMAVDDRPWEEEYEYIWETQFSHNGQTIAAAIKKDGQYAIAKNGKSWPNFFPYATDFIMSIDGVKTACVVQKQSLDEGDIDTFLQGIYTLAVDGQAWEQTFLNVWDPCFDHEGKNIAATIRLAKKEYSLAINGQPWSQTFDCAWKPCFDPIEKNVYAPVEKNSKWGLAKNGELYWDHRFAQLWGIQTSKDGQHLAAIVAPKYGQFTVAMDKKTWSTTYPVLTDMIISPDGNNIAALGQSGTALSESGYKLEYPKWQVIVNNQPWIDWYDNAFKPIFSLDSQHVAVKVEKRGKYTIALDGKIFPQEFSELWDPIFNPESDKVLIKALDGHTFKRIVAPLKSFSGNP